MYTYIRDRVSSTYDKQEDSTSCKTYDASIAELSDDFAFVSLICLGFGDAISGLDLSFKELLLTVPISFWASGFKILSYVCENPKNHDKY